MKTDTFFRTTSKRLVAIAAAALLCSAPAWADGANDAFQQGVAAYSQQNYAKARQYFQAAAKQGNATALTRLGVLYKEGDGVKANRTRARQYYEQAAKLQDVEALYRLGELYMPSGSAEDDYSYTAKAKKEFAKAKRYFEQASDRGSADAAHALGQIYSGGTIFVQPDTEKMLKYYEWASRLGSGAADYELGWRYLSGDAGLKQDYAKARVYLAQSLQRGIVPAAELLARIYLEGLGVRRDRERARQYYQQLADWGQPDAVEILKNWRR